MLPKRIEEASLNAWPALQQILFDGWILRFSKGYTKRANSVNPLFGSSMDVDGKVDVCEKLYAEKGLQPVFRLTPFCSPPDLDQVLENRNYRKGDPTLVLYRDSKSDNIPAPSVELRNEPLDDWIDIFCRLSESPVEKHQTHKEILQAIPARRFLASLADSGQIVACGLGVLENDLFGLFDLVTAPQQRNKGYGTKLVSGLLRWAQENGAWHAYLQVMSHNAPARRLYTKLGFQAAYQYWYRISEVVTVQMVSLRGTK
jgi:GNAT superfamily N-acetyltransferase